MPNNTPAHGTGPARLQQTFLALLPRIEAHARIAFRDLRCPQSRDDAVAETVALSWQWYVRLAARGKDASAFPSVLASYAARAVRSGRRLCGQERSRDPLSPLAQRRRGFAVGRLRDSSILSGSPLEDALRDSTQSPPDEQAAFRIDFPRWLAGLGSHRRRLAGDMALGHRTEDLGAKYALSPARISQLRRDLHADWRRFHGEAPAA
jgi:hypothetical protein